MRIRKALMLLFLISVFCISGCRKQKTEIVEITFIHGWGSTETDHVAMRKIYSDFEKEHPEIKLNMISMPSATDVVSKVGDLLTVGEIPDIIFTAGDGRESIYEFMMEKGYALDLMPVIEKDRELKSNISPIALNYWTTADKKLYTVSDVLMMSGGYWYNKEIFEKAGIDRLPQTREEWLKVCEKIYQYRKEQEAEVYPILLDSNHVVYLTGSILSDENPSMLTEMETKAADLYSIGFQTTLSELKRIAETSDMVNSFNYRDTLLSFNNRETAMYINGVWAATMIEEDLEVGYAPLPTEDGKGVAAISSGVGYILGNTKDKEKMDASITFLKYMLSEEVAKRILAETGQIPANPKVEITEEIAGSRLYEAIDNIKKAEKVIEIPANIWGTTKKDLYGDIIVLYLDEKISLVQLQRGMLE